MSNNIFSNDSTNKTVEEKDKIEENNKSNAENLTETDIIGGFEIGANSIHTPGKTEPYSDVQGMYLGVNGDFATGDGDNFFRVYSNSVDLNGLPISISNCDIENEISCGLSINNGTVSLSIVNNTEDEFMPLIYMHDNTVDISGKNIDITGNMLRLYGDEIDILAQKISVSSDLLADYIGSPKSGVYELYVQQIRRGAAPIYIMPRGMTSTNKAAVFGTTDGAASSYVCLRPGTNNTGWLGMSSYKWNYIYSNHALQTSDRNSKENIKDLELDDRYMKMYDELKPVSFNLKEDDEPLTYTGLVAQDVEDAMEKAGLSLNEFAALRKEKDIEILSDDNENEICKHVLDENGEEKYNYSLDYTKFVALNIMKIKQLEQRIKDLEEQNEQRKAS